MSTLKSSTVAQIKNQLCRRAGKGLLWYLYDINAALSTFLAVALLGQGALYI